MWPGGGTIGRVWTSDVDTASSMIPAILLSCRDHRYVVHTRASVHWNQPRAVTLWSWERNNCKHSRK